MLPEKNYTIGRGQLFFDKFDEDGNTTGQRYIGNTPEINLTSESESLEHYDSDSGIKTKDKSVLLSLNRTGSFITDHISPENLALFFLGSAEVVSVAGAVDVDYEIADIITGMRYQIGQSSVLPAGVRNVSAVTVAKGVTPLVLGTDFTLDADTGGIFFIDGTLLSDGDDVTVTYTLVASENNRVITGASAEIRGALFYKSNNPEGKKMDYYWPSVTLKPDGDFALKGDEWQQMGFTFEILKKDDATEAQYINGRADDGI
jgi:hypothetical protein